jgi:hypothetical protein
MWMALGRCATDRFGDGFLALGGQLVGVHAFDPSGKRLDAPGLVVTKKAHLT